LGNKGDVEPFFNNVPMPEGQINPGDLLVIQRKVLGLVNFCFIDWKWSGRFIPGVRLATGPVVNAADV